MEHITLNWQCRQQGRTRVYVRVVRIKNEELVWKEFEFVAFVSVALMHVEINNHSSFDGPPVDGARVSHCVVNAIESTASRLVSDVKQRRKRGRETISVYTAQHSTAQHSTAQHSTAQHSTAQHSTAQHSTAQHSTAQHSTAQHSTAQHSTAQHSTAQHTDTYVRCGSGLGDQVHKREDNVTVDTPSTTLTE